MNINDNRCWLSIYTPTFNRVKGLSKLYKSLLQQKNKTLFEWIIIDDGSIDDTHNFALSIIEDGEISVVYHYKENGGKHTAHNLAIDIARGEYLVCVDSDEYLNQDAIASVMDYLRNDDGKSGFKIRKAIKNFKEKHEEMSIIYPTYVARKYPFTIFSGETFAPESIVFNQVFNDIELKEIKTNFVITEYQEDGYTYNVNKLMKENPCAYCVYYAQLIDLDNGIKRMVAIGKYYYFYNLSSAEGLEYKGKHRNLVKILRPLGLVFYFYYKHIRHI